MPRIRVGVALVVPPPASDEIDGLRRAIGDRDRDKIPPHVTLVPPVNLRVDEIPIALGVLRDTAASVDGPLHLTFGPPRSFGPRGPVIYLDVRPRADQRDLDLVPRMHQAARRGPLERPLAHPFVPHATLRVDLPADRVVPTLDALHFFELAVALTHVQLLREVRGPTGMRRWRTIADVALGPRRIVGRGGLAVELTRSTVLDPEAAGVLLDWTLLPDDIDPGPPPADLRVVVARREERVVGLITARRDDARMLVDRFAVADEALTHGIGEMLLLELEAMAAEEVLLAVDVPDPVDDTDPLRGVRPLLADRGFEPAADHAGRKVARRHVPVAGAMLRPPADAGPRTAGPVAP
ncbi:MAG TPA: GNAT family N-acetyltransferase [Acidimicrobiales bacterium]|nr:GNAT family N-acetyltransferase [Acidimicrobiales bacterium]